MLEKLSWFVLHTFLSLSPLIYLFYYLSLFLSLDFAAIPSRHPEVLYAWTLCQTVGKRYGPLPVIALLGCIHFCAPFVYTGCNAALFRKWKNASEPCVAFVDDQLDVAVELFWFSLYHFDRSELSVNNRVCYARVIREQTCNLWYIFEVWSFFFFTITILQMFRTNLFQRDLKIFIFKGFIVYLNFYSIGFIYSSLQRLIFMIEKDF